MCMWCVQLCLYMPIPKSVGTHVHLGACYGDQNPRPHAYTASASLAKLPSQLLPFYNVLSLFNNF